jgi:hypothetical protein
MNKPRPDVLGNCHVGQHIKKTGYLLFRILSNHFVEPFISISNEEMEARGLLIMMDHLRNEPNSDSYRRMNFDNAATKKTMLKIKRNHVFVSILLLLSDREELEILPLHFNRGWSLSGRSQEVRMFSLPMTNQEFTARLAEAFEIAS